MREGSLFTGYGGLGMAAADVLGAEPAWFVDHDPAATALLAYRYPGVPNFGDITDVDWHTVEPVDVLTAGWPCQDISNAGKRAGIGGERSGLWSYVADAVRVLRPRYLLAENVAALVVRGLDTVLADLAALGFAAEWATVRASEVGAPHRRERFFLAAADATRDGRSQWRTKHVRLKWGFDVAECGAPLADADSDRRQGQSERDREPEHDRASCGNHAHGPGVDWGHYGPAIRHWETIVGRTTPEPTVMGQRGRHVLNPALPEWLMGLPAGWITDVPGLSRNAQLRLAGNGIVPQQATAAYAYLLPLLDGAEVAA